jgi:peptidyl-prolyl cis-trans isomerase B (cyclophilin B)
MGRVILPLYTPRYLPNGREVAVITTSKGVIKVALDGIDAPLTVGNFIELSRRGFYENLKFHAYRADSAILGGCPITRSLGPAQVDAAVRGAVHGIHPGRGDASYTIKDEYQGKANNHHELGSIVFAHKSEPDSGSCQFYFSLAKQPEYDDSFVVFGKTIEGLDVVQLLWVGDAILKIEIEGANEEALEKAVSHEPPKPEKTPTDVFNGLRAPQK